MVFPSLCYWAKINKLIFLVNFTTQKHHFQDPRVENGLLPLLYAAFLLVSFL